MENFFYNDRFHMDFDTLIEDVEDNEDCEIKDLPDIWSISVELTKLEPVHKFGLRDIDILIDNVYEDRLTEEGEELGTIRKILIENINFEKINSAIPTLYYPTGQFKNYILKMM